MQRRSHIQTPPVIDPSFAKLAVQQVRLDPRSGLIREPVKPCHCDFLRWKPELRKKTRVVANVCLSRVPGAAK